MITDAFLRLENGDSSSSAITATRVTENVVDLLQAREIGEGRDLYLVYTVTGADGTGAGTATFQVYIADNAAMSTNAEVIASSAAYVGTTLDIPSASAPNGTVIVVPIPPRVASLGRRYLSGRIEVSGTVGAAKVICDIVTDIQDGRKFYASGFTVANP
jgi:hypothetical protein